MRLSLHAVLCCCVFTSVLPTVKGATGEPITGLRKRLRVWLQGHVKRDLRSSVESVRDEHAESLSAPSSFPENLRPKRSASSKSSGCFLITCVYHDLFHQLYELNNKLKEDKAPKDKIGFKGYGRRRRSLVDAAKQGRSATAGVRGSRSTVA